MSLYISNPSKQDVVFPYRLNRKEDIQTSPKSIPVPSGKGVEIGKSWTPEQKDYVIEQLHLHGARDASEAHGHLGKFIGLLYRDKGQISEDEILMAHEQVVKTQQERSREAFEKSGQAIDMKINPMKSGRRNAKLTELSVTQELRPGERRTGDEVEFAMTIAPDGFRDAANPA